LKNVTTQTPNLTSHKESSTCIIYLHHRGNLKLLSAAIIGNK
jgi:hypothetical protein